MKVHGQALAIVLYNIQVSGDSALDCLLKSHHLFMHFLSLQ